MGELADEQNEENARRMQLPDQKDALAGRIGMFPGDADKGAERKTPDAPNGEGHGLQRTQV